MNPKRPFRPTGRNNLLLLLLLVIVIAVAVMLAWSDTPPGAPHPSTTATPSVGPQESVPPN